MTRVRTLLLLLLAAWPGIACLAADPNPIKDVSPKLKQFLADHPAASEILSRAHAEAFGNRKLEINYFYSDDMSIASAEHMYPGPASVLIRIRENQTPADEFICLLFEMLNSENEKRFQQVDALIQPNKISRTDYAREKLKLEFVTEQRTRDLLPKLGLSSKEIADSYIYNRLIHMPDDFDTTLAYVHKVSPKRRIVEYYEENYDQLRKYYDAQSKGASDAKAK